MTFGFRATNDAGLYIIDGENLNLNVIQRGAVSNNTWVSFPDRGIYPHIFIKLPAVVGAPGRALWCGPSNIAGVGSPKTHFMWLASYGAVTAYPPMEYAVASLGAPAAPPQGSYGLNVWNASGQLVFNSMYQQPRIRLAVDLPDPEAWGHHVWGAVIDVPLPDNSMDWWVALPTTPIICDSFTDQGQTWVQLGSIFALYTANNVMRFFVAQVAEYGFTWGGFGFYECDGATGKIYIAKMVT